MYRRYCTSNNQSENGGAYTSADVTIDQHGVITVGINGASETANLTNFTMKASLDGAAAVTVADSSFSASAFNADYTVAIDDLGETVLTFIITDENGETATTSFKVTTEAVDDFYTYTAVLMGGQLNPTKGSFYSTTTNDVFLWADANAAQASIDFVYYYGETNKGTMAAPADATVPSVANFSAIANWNPRNATKFKAVTVADWSIVTSGDISSLATGMTATKANMLAVNDVIAFETASTSTNPGKKGLFKVMDMKGTTAGTDREITIEVKILH